MSNLYKVIKLREIVLVVQTRDNILKNAITNKAIPIYSNIEHQICPRHPGFIATMQCDAGGGAPSERSGGQKIFSALAGRTVHLKSSPGRIFTTGLLRTLAVL